MRQGGARHPRPWEVLPEAQEKAVLDAAAAVLVPDSVGLDDVERIHRNGARVNFLPDASHWVHIDNPQGQPAREKWPTGGAAARQPGLGRRAR